MVVGLTACDHAQEARLQARRTPSNTMPKRSAGILPYRKRDGAWQVLLVHPGGPFWARKEAGAWSIAKGEYAPPEPALEAAIREFAEETGHLLPGPFQPLQPVRLKSGKVIDAWATASDWDLSNFRSNTFELAGRQGGSRTYPEVDRIEWFSLDVARDKIHAGQAALLVQLEALLGT
jgi:predicted NUDIX family NTP pyrophosphohydrolase